MSILIFIIILAVLILVHEFGHFLTAKLFKIRVDEFGIGYPPKAATLFRWWNTDFTLNWLPFGGFVKIFGENGEGVELEDGTPNPEAEKSFVRKPRIQQALVLVAGVVCNLIFAWLLISVGFMIGLPTSTSGLTDGQRIENPKLVITMISPDSPAAAGGLKAGDVISRISAADDSLENVDDSNDRSNDRSEDQGQQNLTPETVSNFIAEHGENEIAVTYVRGQETGTATVTPAAGIIENRKAIGISMDMIGTVSLSVGRALVNGAKITASLTQATAVGLATFVYDAVRGQSDFSQVTGPVGIVGLVGDASKLGFIYLLSFTAFISINLAVINLIPFPALDGGRLLFVIIESIKRSPISPKVSNILNTVGFLLLVGLMILVTVHDVVKLF